MAKTEAKGAVRLENPLMPDERLRQMYTAMVQMRMLEGSLAGAAGSTKTREERDRDKVRGEEAARASTVLSLEPGDLLSDCVQSPGMDLMMGVGLGELKRAARGGGRKKATVEVADRPVRRLPLAADTAEQMQMALGAAAALKAQRGGRVLLVYTRVGAAKSKRWERTLRVAGSRELPVIFVLLPERRVVGSVSRSELWASSRGWGVPGFPVDGSDAIALYRVMQESLLRGRAGGGPVLIECIPFRLEGKSLRKLEDPLERLEELLLAKGAASETWVRRTRSSFARRIG